MTARLPSKPPGCGSRARAEKRRAPRPAVRSRGAQTSVRCYRCKPTGVDQIEVAARSRVLDLAIERVGVGLQLELARALLAVLIAVSGALHVNAGKTGERVVRLLAPLAADLAEWRLGVRPTGRVRVRRAERARDSSGRRAEPVDRKRLRRLASARVRAEHAKRSSSTSRARTSCATRSRHCSRTKAAQSCTSRSSSGTAQTSRSTCTSTSSTSLRTSLRSTPKTRFAPRATRAKPLRSQS
jgi:hypothetical protein